MSLGRAITILIDAHRKQLALHDDVDAWGAPGECHEIVARGAEKRWRIAQRHACSVAGVKNIRQLRDAVRARLGNDRFIYKRYGFVPY